MPLVMGVDSSIDATTVEVRDADDGRLVARGRARHPQATPPRSEQDPGAWWEALITAVSQAGITDIAALAVAGQQHGLVAVDAAGAVLRPAKLSNDTESAPQAAAMARRLGIGRWVKACGSAPRPWLTVTKLAWLAQSEPAVLARLGTALLPHDWLTYRLTGRLVSDRGDASGTGYWSPGEIRWRSDILESVVGDPPGAAASWHERLPEVLGPSEPSDWMGASVHELLGLRGRPLCAAGTGYTMALALGAGLGVGDVVVGLDRVGMVAALSNTAIVDPTGAVAGFADASGRFLPLVYTGHPAGDIEAFSRALGADAESLAALAARAPAGSNGVIFVPEFGALLGLHPAVDRADVVRALLEGTACRALDAVDGLVKAGAPCDGRIVLAGAGTLSAAIGRIVADLSGRAVVVAADLGTAAKGACVQAAAVLHERDPAEVAEAWTTTTAAAAGIVQPDPAVDGSPVRTTFVAARDRLETTEKT